MATLWELPGTASEHEGLTESQVIDFLNHWLNVRRDPNWPQGLSFWRTEWEYKRQSSVAERAERIAVEIKRLTWVILGFTVVTAVATICAVLR